MRNTEANRLARNKIAEIAEEKGIESCEIKLPGCMVTFGLAPCHRHKRAWYSGDVELLSDYNQWVGGCTWCHNIIEDDKELTEKTFKRLRS